MVGSLLVSAVWCGPFSGAAVLYLNAAGADKLQQRQKGGDMVLRLLLAAEQPLIFCKGPLSSPRSMWETRLATETNWRAVTSGSKLSCVVSACGLRPIRVEPR